MRILLLHVLLVIYACSLSHGSLLPFKESIYTHTFERRDLVTSGNFEISSCGVQAPLVVETLHQTHDFLLEAINSLPPPIGNGSGITVYNAFFKDVNPAVVKAIYEKIAHGTNITIQGVPYLPTIICSNEEDPRFAHVWQYCTPRSNEITIGIYLDSSPIIFLCPVWSHIPVYSQPNMCGTVNSLGTKLSYPYSFSLTKYHTMVHELAHIYIGSALQTEDEVYEVNDCMALSPEKSVINAQNYAFYTSCESFYYSKPSGLLGCVANICLHRS